MWEVKRELSTQDFDGRDVQFVNNLTYTGFAASSKFHGLDSVTTEFRFKLSESQLGDEIQIPIASVKKISMKTFFIKYINISLIIGIALLSVIVLIQIRF